MKSVGIIGGLGPEATASFYLEVINQCRRQHAARRPSIVVSSVPLPVQLEKDLILSNTGMERYIPFIVAEARRLEVSGVDFLVMPCNTLHNIVGAIRAAVSVPVLSIVDVTMYYLGQRACRRVGLLSTSTTANSNLYGCRAGTGNNIAFTTPSDSEQSAIDSIVQRLLEGRQYNKDRARLHRIVAGLSTRGVDCVVLACTDLQLLLDTEGHGLPVLDTMKLLAEATAKEILASASSYPAQVV